jgi:inorganic pyrophosphatase
MSLDKVAEKNTPEEFNVVIEIPMNDSPVKYEFDKESGMLFVDRFMQTSMRYPCNYGFIPGTLSKDGDPMDVLVVSHHPVIPGSVVKARPVGVLLMEDDGGQDEKVIAVPVSKLDVTFEKVKDLEDLCPMLRSRIEHFFEHYKELEKGKWVKIHGWGNKTKAMNLIKEAMLLS